MIQVRARDAVAHVGEDDLVVGRSPYCSLVLDGESVSRVHAVFRRDGDAVIVEDLGSTHGTWVGGARVGAPVRLAPGAVVVIGRESVGVERITVADLRSTGSRWWAHEGDAGTASEAKSGRR